MASGKFVYVALPFCGQASLTVANTSADEKIVGWHFLSLYYVRTSNKSYTHKYSAILVHWYSVLLDLIPITNLSQLEIITISKPMYQNIREVYNLCTNVNACVLTNTHTTHTCTVSLLKYIVDTIPTVLINSLHAYNVPSNFISPCAHWPASWAVTFVTYA